MIDFPVTREMALTVGGLALIVAAVIELAKPYIQKWGADLWVNAAAFLLAEVLAIGGTFIGSGFEAQALYEAVLLGVFGALGATGGYELLKNLAQFVGWQREP